MFAVTNVANATDCGSDKECKESLLYANISLPDNIGAKYCKENKVNNISIVWSGVNDKRSNNELGILQKGKEESRILESKPVAELLNERVKDLLTRCGYNLNDKAKVNVGINLDEFFADTKKGIIIGKTEAKSAITIDLRNAYRSYELNFSASKEIKGFNGKKLSKLESSLGEVLVMVLEEFISSKQFVESVQELNKI